MVYRLTCDGSYTLVMSGRHPSAMKPADSRSYGVIQHALDSGYKETGEPYVVKGLPTHTIANEARLSVGRGLAHYNLSRACWVVDGDGNPCYQNCVDENAPHGVAFRLLSKQAGRAYIVQKTGGDPSKLKYNPWRRKKPTPFNDDGTPPSA